MPAVPGRGRAGAPRVETAAQAPAEMRTAPPRKSAPKTQDTGGE
jgi:hypothetical protein